MTLSHANNRFFEHGSRRILAVLIVAVVVPAGCVIWFMIRAMQNEQLAVQQRLTGVYTNQLASVQRRIDLYWNERLETIQQVTAQNPAERFALIVQSNLADAVVVFDEDGRSGYPENLQLGSTPASPESTAWSKARKLEYETQDFNLAAQAYAEIANGANDPNAKARALLARANCLSKAGDRAASLTALFDLSSDPSLANAVGSQGSLIIPNAQLRFLRLGVDASDERHQTILARLVPRLNDYSNPTLTASQRRFLMGQVLALSASEPDNRGAEKEFSLFPTLEAERFAADYLETPAPAASEQLTRITESPDTWHIQTADKSVTALFQTKKVVSELSELIRTEFPLSDATIELLPPGQVRPQNNPIPLESAGTKMPGWNLAIAFVGPDPFAMAYQRQFTIYLWSGILVVGMLIVFAFVLARYLTAQMRLAQMKNELVSTVSHELKTPLASMRALVDTLLAKRVGDPDQAREYLELLSRENSRLSQLIENFLTFSRIERGQQQFQFESVSPETVARNAVDALSDRLSSENCRFTFDADNHLPNLSADSNALTTALVNLLDNALKYSADPKRISLEVSRVKNEVCFEVSDNGIGLDSSERKRIFDRFYQVDQSMTRQRGGCGLGLNIVQHIVHEHGGMIEVESEPGKGSLFRIRIPR